MARRINRQIFDTRRRIGDWTRFWRALPKVGPRRMVVTESVFGSLAHYINNSGLWYRPETGNGRFHKFSCFFSHDFIAVAYTALWHELTRAGFPHFIFPMYTWCMESLPYIPGLKPADPGPLSRFIPPLEEGTVSTWLSGHASTGSWLLDPFGFAPQVAIEAARAGYRVLVTVNNPITRFLLEMAAHPPDESDFKAALADLAVLKKGDEHLENSSAIALCHELRKMRT